MHLVEDLPGTRKEASHLAILLVTKMRTRSRAKTMVSTLQKTVRLAMKRRAATIRKPTIIVRMLLPATVLGTLDRRFKEKMIFPWIRRIPNVVWNAAKNSQTTLMSSITTKTYTYE